MAKKPPPPPTPPTPPLLQSTVTTTTVPRRPISGAIKTVGNIISKISLEQHPAGEWLFTILAILILVGIITGVFFGSRYVGIRYNRSKFNIFKTNFGKIFQMDYRSKLFFKRFNTMFQGINEKPSSFDITDRPVITGRCDNLTMRERSGMCINTIEPKPIIWILDSDSMPDYDKMNKATKKLVVGEKYIVKIPWTKYENDGMHYYPNCSKATFADGSSAEYLFEKDDTSYCTRKKVERTKSTKKKRNILDNWTSLTDYVS